MHTLWIRAGAGMVLAALVGVVRTIKGIRVAVEIDPSAQSAGDGGAAAHLHGPEVLLAAAISRPAGGDRAVGGSGP